MAATIGIVSIGQAQSFFAERYFREILTAASRTALERGCQLKLIPLSHQQAASLDSAREVLAAQGIEALLVVAPSEALLAALGAIFATTPGMIISPPRLDINLSYVASDNYGATRQLVDHLGGHGRRRILLLRPDILTGDYWERTRGYEVAARMLELPALVASLQQPTTADQLRALLDAHRPDALIAPSDAEALRLITLLNQLGLRVPQDVALVGFDDEDAAADATPPLTTVAQPLDEMARRATLYLADRLAGLDRHVYHAVLSNRLVVRESCGAHGG
jgi:LacI family transcriptional regulator